LVAATVIIHITVVANIVKTKTCDFIAQINVRWQNGSLPAKTTTAAEYTRSFIAIQSMSQ
jgi:hypothetical protein